MYLVGWVNRSVRYELVRRRFERMSSERPVLPPRPVPIPEEIPRTHVVSCTDCGSPLRVFPVPSDSNLPRCTDPKEAELPAPQAAPRVRS